MPHTEPVRHEPPPPDETDGARRKREHAEHERIVRALRALDAEASAAHRAKEQRRDRLRKRVKAAQRLSDLPALPIPEGDPAWALPVGERPHFIGEHVWLPDPINSAPPQLGSIRHLYRDGVAEVATHQGATLTRVPATQLVSLGAPVPTFIGQRVGMRSGRGQISEDAAIAAVHDDGTVDVQLFNASTGTYDGPIRRHLVTIVKPDTLTRLANIHGGTMGDKDGQGCRWNTQQGCWEPEHLQWDGTPPYGYSYTGWLAGKSRVALLVFNSTTLKYDYVNARVIAVHEDYTGDMQLFNQSSREYDGPVHHRISLKSMYTSSFASSSTFSRLDNDWWKVYQFDSSDRMELLHEVVYCSVNQMVADQGPRDLPCPQCFKPLELIDLKQDSPWCETANNRISCAHLCPKWSEVHFEQYDHPTDHPCILLHTAGQCAVMM